MLTNIQQIFEEYWDEYVADVLDWQRLHLVQNKPTIKDFVQWLEEHEINLDEIEPTYIQEATWEDVRSQ